MEPALHDLGGSGPPLLLVHANGLCAHVWLPVAERLADRWHVWAPDLRGHGDAAPIPDGFGWEGYGEDVLAVVEALGGGPIAAAGHSMGAASLLRAEADQPGTFTAVYGYEPIVFPPVPDLQVENPMAAQALRRRADFDSREQAFANYASKPPFDRLDPAALRAYVDHGFADTDDGVTLKCRPETEAHNFGRGHLDSMWSRLGEVNVPVTVAGSGDGGPPSQVAEAVADALPKSRFVRHDDLTHFGPLEDPTQIAADIERAVTA